MTAPALADKLGDVASDEGLARFVDEVACLIRSQAAGIFGNLLAVVPVVLGAQWLARAAFGAPIDRPGAGRVHAGLAQPRRADADLRRPDRRAPVRRAR